MVSVIVPIYNVEGFLRQCVDSILGQTYNDLEVILVDDGSTDSCPAICDEYAAIDSRVRVIHKPNGGLSDARNAGLDIATGQYITLVDSDDLLHTSNIEILMGMIVKYGADISMCQRRLIDENGNFMSTRNPVGQDMVIEGNRECMKKFFTSCMVDTVAWGKIYKADIFKEVRYPKGRYHEDVFTTYLTIAQCEKMAITSEQLYYYRVRQGSITQTSFSPKHLDAVYGKEKQAQFIAKHYPELITSAESGIIYGCNQCVLRLGLSSNDIGDYAEFLQSRYRQHIKSYLQSSNRAVVKAFALSCYVSVNSTIHVLRAYKWLKGLYRK